MGGSLGMAAGEAVIAGLETAVERGTPFIMFAASGGARMQEGILSLMQLPRTTVAVQMLREAKQPYIVVLTNPTTGGVTASYAMLGDVHIAEPGALIGFAGPRVIEQTIREKLPEGFQHVGVSARPRHGRHGGASPRAARDARRAVPRADQGRQRPAPKRSALPELPPPRRATWAGAGLNGRRARERKRMSAYEPIIARLLALHPKLIDLSLDRIWRILDALGHPERKLPPVIHVAGTNGKGSTVAFMRAMLEAAGPQRPRLHLAASGALQRALPARRAGRRPAGQRRGARRACWRNASAPMAASRSRCSRSRPRRRSCCSRAIRPTCCCSKSASAAGSTPPM